MRIDRRGGYHGKYWCRIHWWFNLNELYIVMVYWWINTFNLANDSVALLSLFGAICFSNLSPFLSSRDLTFLMSPWAKLILLVFKLFLHVSTLFWISRMSASLGIGNPVWWCRTWKLGDYDDKKSFVWSHVIREYGKELLLRCIQFFYNKSCETLH